MSKRYHVNKDGNVGECDAKVRHCPVGGEHFSSEDKATAAWNADKKAFEENRRTMSWTAALDAAAFLNRTAKREKEYHAARLQSYRAAKVLTRKEWIARTAEREVASEIRETRSPKVTPIATLLKSGEHAERQTGPMVEKAKEVTESPRWKTVVAQKKKEFQLRNTVGRYNQYVNHKKTVENSNDETARIILDEGRNDSHEAAIYFQGNVEDAWRALQAATHNTPEIAKDAEVRVWFEDTAVSEEWVSKGNFLKTAYTNKERRWLEELDKTAPPEPRHLS